MLCMKETAENFLLSRRLLSICDVRQEEDYMAKLSDKWAKPEAKKALWRKNVLYDKC